MRLPLLLLTTLLAVAVPAARASADDLIYTTTDNGTSLATVDPATGTSTVVGPFGYSDTFGLAVDTDGSLWTVVNDTSSSDQIARVDKATGAATPLPGAIGAPLYAIDIAGDGTIYGLGMSDDTLYRIDKATGVGTAVGGPSGLSSAMDIAFDCDGTLWGTTMGDLYTIDTTTGVATMRLSMTGFAGATNVMGLMFDSSCRMLATTYSSPGKLYSIDTTTGAGTLVGTTSLNAPHGGSIRSFTPDHAAPATTDDVPGAWRDTAPTVTLTSSDGAGSGVAHIYCTIGVDPPAPTSSSPEYDPAHKPVLANGERIRYFAVDRRGNAEAPKTSPAAKVDTVAPVSGDDVPATSQSRPVTVTLSATDGAAGVAAIHYEAGANPAAPTAASPVYDPARKPVLAGGERIRYFAVDNAGNAEVAKTSRAAQVVAPVRTSVRLFTVHLPSRTHGHAVRSVGATIDGAKAKVVHSRRGYALRIDLRGHDCSPAKVRIELKLAHARAVTLHRTYLTCTPGQ